MADNRYFTAQEIDALIPRLEKIFEHVESCRSRAAELAAQTLAIQESDDAADIAQTQMKRSQVQFLLEAIQQDIDDVQRLGGITKDIEMGLVDFLGDVEDQDVWLCWKNGQRQVRFWHSLESGYRQRRALPQAGPAPH
jgi:hypothetical protein